MLPLEESTVGGMQMKRREEKYGENEGKQCEKPAGLCTRHSGSLCDMGSDIAVS